MTVTGLILPVLLHCGILEHPHQDFSMQNKLLKVTDRPYSHLKPPKDVHIIIWAANLPEECVKSRRPAADAPRRPAAPRGSSLLLLWARSLRMPGCQSTQGCCLSPCAAAAVVDLKLVKGILKHLWIQSVYGHARDFWWFKVIRGLSTHICSNPLNPYTGRGRERNRLVLFVWRNSAWRKLWHSRCGCRLYMIIFLYFIIYIYIYIYTEREREREREYLFYHSYYFKTPNSNPSESVQSDKRANMTWVDA